MGAIELPPFTDAHRAALERCRFVTVNLERSRAFAFTDDEEIVKLLAPTKGAVGGAADPDATPGAGAIATASRYRQSSDANHYSWEMSLSHPDAVAFVCDLVDRRHA